MNAALLQKCLLRLTGTVEILAFFAVVMPRAWMEITHEWLGMGVMPDGTVVNYIIRQASFMYGLHGVLMWLLSCDLVRYRPLIVFSGISYLLAAPVLFVIEWRAGMPWFWTMGEPLSCLGVGIAMLWLDSWIQRGNSTSAPPR